MQLECPDPALLMRICGQGDENLEFLESKQNVRVLRRGELITVAGDEEKDVRQAHALLLQIRDAAQDGHQFRPQDFRYVLETLRKNGHVDVAFALFGTAVHHLPGQACQAAYRPAA